MRARIALIGEYDPDFPPHAATAKACAHSATALGAVVEPVWMSTADVGAGTVREFAGVWIAPGSPYKSLQNTMAVIQAAREGNVPCLGTCGGCQHMIIEYARNALGFEDAQHAEYDPYASNLFISALECSLVGREMQLRFRPGSRVASIYGAYSAVEQYYCNFGVNPTKVGYVSSRDLRVTGSDDEGEVRVIELPGHPFFIGTLYVPQMRSTPERPHPLVTAFMTECRRRTERVITAL